MRLPVDVEGCLDVDLPGAGAETGRLLLIASGRRVEIATERFRDLRTARREARGTGAGLRSLAGLFGTFDLDAVFSVRGHPVVTLRRSARGFAWAGWRLHLVGLLAAALGRRRRDPRPG